MHQQNFNGRKLYKKYQLILSLMSRKEKLQLFYILLSSIIDGLINVVGVASILPFISVISEPEIIQSNEYIIKFSELTGIVSYSGIIVVFGLISFLVIVFGNFISTLDTWVSTRFGYFKEKHLSKQLLLRYLKMDILTFRCSTDAEKVKNILTETDRVIIDTLFAMLEMVTGIIMALLIFGLLLMIDMSAALVIFSVFLLAYFCIYLLTSKQLNKLGQDFSEIETDLYDDVMTPLNSHLEIKLVQKAEYFIVKYSQSFDKLIKNRLSFEFISLIPQVLLEIVAFGSIIILAIYFSLTDNSGLAAVTMISLYAFAAYRLMPAISAVFDSFEQIQYSSAVLNRLIKQFPADQIGYHNGIKFSEESEPSAYQVNQCLELKGIKFSFNVNSISLFKKLSISFAAEKFHCIIGKTGSGKSTLLNIIAGLYDVENGLVEVDGKVIRTFENVNWLSNLSYVTSRVNLIESSILENIALGVEFKKINTKKVIKYCKLVDLDEHINTLALGYSSIVGKDQLSFSSGQIQKIGIARALYREPSLLLMDESTNAFDMATEKLVLENIKRIKKLTVIVVSHRPSVQNFCDNVIDLKEILKRPLKNDNL